MNCKCDSSLHLFEQQTTFHLLFGIYTVDYFMGEPVCKSDKKLAELSNLPLATGVRNCCVPQVNIQ
jgi:hypothetical protein